MNETTTYQLRRYIKWLERRHSARIPYKFVYGADGTVTAQVYLPKPQDVRAGRACLFHLK